jgi:hypothetical protein
MTRTGAIAPFWGRLSQSIDGDPALGWQVSAIQGILWIYLKGFFHLESVPGCANSSRVGRTADSIEKAIRHTRR